MSSVLAVNPGLNSFKDFFIDNNGVFRNVVYYVDKTPFIEKAYNHNAIVTIFTRPKRFGKSMFLSMLKTFFEPNTKNPNDLTIHEKIFSQFEIYKNKEFCEENMGKLPVLYVSFASLGSTKGYNYSLSFLAKAIRICAEQYEFLLDSNKLSEINKLKFKELLNLDSLELSQKNLELKVDDALLSLCKFLYKHYEEKVIVLIDEYDVPLAFAAQTNYYESFKELISNMLEKLLKGNEQLDKAFLTGCLRIAKESIFTGFNNFRVADYDNINFSSLFGFTQDEVKDILKNFNLEDHFDEYKAWYDGYLFGNDEIYCPWDVLCYTSDLIENPNSHPQAYWNNSSENRLAMYAFDNNPNDYAEEFRTLLDGKSIVAPYYESMNYKMIMNVDSNDENYLWTILYMTGYLTKDKNQEGVEEGNVRLRIPNICVKACLEDQIKWTFSMKNPMFKMLSLEYIECFKNDDYGEFQALLNDP